MEVLVALMTPHRETFHCSCHIPPSIPPPGQAGAGSCHGMTRCAQEEEEKEDGGRGEKRKNSEQVKKKKKDCAKTRGFRTNLGIPGPNTISKLPPQRTRWLTVSVSPPPSTKGQTADSIGLTSSTMPLPNKSSDGQCFHVYSYVSVKLYLWAVRFVFHKVFCLP